MKVIRLKEGEFKILKQKLPEDSEKCLHDFTLYWDGKRFRWRCYCGKLG